MALSKRWTVLAGTFLIVFLWTTGGPAYAGSATPFITNYSKREYKAANQNWSVAQAPNGMLYVANSEGLLAFDGSQWTLMELPDATIDRKRVVSGKSVSVRVDREGS